MEDEAVVGGWNIVGVGRTLERDAALVAVAHLMSEARDGRGGALFVVGEAGLGKTTILDQARGLAYPDIRVGWARGDVMETSLPFGLIAAVIDALDAPGNLLELPGRSPSADDAQAERFGRVLHWLKATVTEPVLLILDDLHWADPDSLALVSFLVRRIRKLPVAVLAALRPWPRATNDLAVALTYDGYATVERLAPLSRDAAATLLAARLGGPISAAASCTALDLCGGNPLLLEQVATMVGRGTDMVAPTWNGNSCRTKIVLTRFAGVPEVAIRCAQAASVLGTRFRPELATAVAQLNEQEADVALDALCRSGLVRSETEMAAEFVYPLFRQALYDDLAVPVRTRLHARAFTALIAQGLHREAIDHAVRADLAGDEVAITAMTHAGMVALRSGASALATRHLHAAVDAAGNRADADLLLALAGSLVITGRPDEAIPLCHRLRYEQQLMGTQRIQALRLLGRAFSATGAYNDSITHFMEAAELAETHNPAVTIEVLLDASLASLMSTGPAKSLPLAERAYTLAGNSEAPLSNRAASVWGYLAFLSGDPQGLTECEMSARTVKAADLASHHDLRWSWDALSTFSIAATLAERFDDAEDVLRMLVTAAGHMDAAEVTCGLAITQAIVAARRGRLAEALDFTERTTSAINPLSVYVSQADSIRADVLHQMGRDVESMEWCDRLEPDATARDESFTLLRLWNVRGQQLLRGGRPEAASEIYVQLEEQNHRMGIGEPCLIPWARHAIAAHLSAGRTQDVHRVLEWLDRGAARLPCRYPRIAAATGRASLAEAEGDYEAAEAHFSSALTLHDRVDLPLEQVETLLRYGAFLRRRGRPCQARPLLAEAAMIAESHQAGWLHAQVCEELAAAGGRRRRNRSHEDATRLTTQEQRVAGLAAAGHSNKAIAARLTLSVKTIEYHLQQVYTKLGISSRRQLMTGHHEGERSLIASAS
jgi:ATP/maltotriose-dependent transcriptional regulator MalT